VFYDKLAKSCPKAPWSPLAKGVRLEKLIRANRCRWSVVSLLARRLGWACIPNHLQAWVKTALRDYSYIASILAPADLVFRRRRFRTWACRPKTRLSPQLRYCVYPPWWKGKAGSASILVDVGGG